MLAAQRIGLAMILLVLDVLITGVAFWLAYALRFGSFDVTGAEAFHRTDHVVLAVALIAGWVAALWLGRMYRFDQLIARRAVLPRIALLAPAVGIAVAAVLFLAQAKLASRLVFGYGLVFATVGTWLVRVLVLAVRRSIFRRSGLSALIVGAGPLARELAEFLDAHPETGYRLVGHLARPTEEPELEVIGTTDQLSEVLDREVIDQVERGYRMAQPSHISYPESKSLPKEIAAAQSHVYKIMLECWNRDPFKRPTFEFLTHMFEDFNITTQNQYME